jgi:hypothetical protein
MSEETKQTTLQATEIKGGVIIQGSLFWENEQNCLPSDTKGKDRKVWRESYLQMTSEFPIPFPIRYGRSSSTRLCSYTMVASREYYEQNKNGQAKVVPYITPFNENSLLGITNQIQQLAKVEGIWKESNRRFANDWGAITIWINPKSNKQPILEKF